MAPLMYCCVFICHSFLKFVVLQRKDRVSKPDKLKCKVSRKCLPKEKNYWKETPPSLRGIDVFDVIHLLTQPCRSRTHELHSSTLMSTFRTRPTVGSTVILPAARVHIKQ